MQQVDPSLPTIGAADCPSFSSFPLIFVLAFATVVVAVPSAFIFSTTSVFSFPSALRVAFLTKLDWGAFTLAGFVGEGLAGRTTPMSSYLPSSTLRTFASSTAVILAVADGSLFAILLLMASPPSFFGTTTLEGG